MTARARALAAELATQELATLEHARAAARARRTAELTTRARAEASARAAAEAEVVRKARRTGFDLAAVRAEAETHRAAAARRWPDDATLGSGRLHLVVAEARGVAA